LTRYVDDGRLEIDNNQCENAIRPTAVGKKNFLFVGHPQAEQRSAVIYSVLGNCRRHGINPAEYLQDVLERLPKAKTSEVKSLTPAAWAKARRNAARPSA
jgi:transposase